MSICSINTEVSRSANKNPSDEDSAGMAWLDERTKALEAYTKDLEGNGESWSESLSCQKELLTYRHAIVKTLEWAQAEKKSWQVISAQTDEDGNFRIPIPRPGKYVVLVRGRAGFNEAVWQDTDLEITPGQVTTVKLASPEKACLDTEGE